MKSEWRRPPRNGVEAESAPGAAPQNLEARQVALGTQAQDWLGEDSRSRHTGDGPGTQRSRNARRSPASARSTGTLKSVNAVSQRRPPKDQVSAPNLPSPQRSRAGRFRRYLTVILVPTLASKIRPGTFEESYRVSLERWKQESPDPGLTLGVGLSDGLFVDRLMSMFPFTKDTRILEIGPGYGRIVREVLQRRIPFASYVGVDLSPRNVQFLTTRYGSANVRFVEGEVDKLTAEEPFDLVYASLTFQHFYPDFGRTLAHLRTLMRAGSARRIIFDVPERKWYHPFSMYYEAGKRGTNFTRVYSKANILRLVEGAGLSLRSVGPINFTQVRSNLLIEAG